MFGFIAYIYAILNTVPSHLFTVLNFCINFHGLQYQITSNWVVSKNGHLFSFHSYSFKSESRWWLDWSLQELPVMIISDAFAVLPVVSSNSWLSLANRKVILISPLLAMIAHVSRCSFHKDTWYVMLGFHPSAMWPHLDLIALQKTLFPKISFIHKCLVNMNL